MTGRVLEGLLGLAFRIWETVVFRQHLGPHAGRIGGRLAALDLAGAFPDAEPTVEELGAAASWAYDSGPTEQLRRANLWAAALGQHLVAEPEQVPRGTVLTTYGFATVRGRVRLCAIHYVRVARAFGFRAPQPIVLSGGRFPVVVRLWRALPDRPTTAAEARQQPVNGFKPVRMPTRRGHVDADIVEHQGGTAGLVVTSRHPARRDRGRIVLDREFAHLDHLDPAGSLPYATYLGRTHGRVANGVSRLLGPAGPDRDE